ncbi:odorant-binding protein 59a [Drosophila innubila]|uniref:odorant-binding protein 59a n=1 Tax=Drosophila innubila TaxID=198719 RepID=UPI00148D7E57|nr:odorant-binding protein 59a [Drosophila innubila]
MQHWRTVFEMRLVLLILLCGCCGIWSLKCRSQDGVSDEELKRIVRGCMQRRERDRDRDRQGQGQQQSYGNRWQRSLKHSDMNNNRPNNNNNNNNNNNYNNNNNSNNNNTELSSCVAQCFFEEMNMVDGNGQPDRRKVSYLLTKDLRDRALRNFYMDTVQQCFRYLEQSRYQSNNKCGQSRELIKCMSEYAKAQCDDWEEHSNLLFN